MSIQYGGDKITFQDGSTVASGWSGFKNRIINGAMMIDQRNAGASVTPTTSTYTLDRWRVLASQSSKFSLQQNAGSVTPPVGFTNYLGVTSLSAYSVTTGDIFSLQQKIEGYNVADLGYGTANASTITLSFWVRSSLTGTFGGVFKNEAVDRNYIFSYTINAANTWEQKTITVSGDTTGTWLTNNNNGLDVRFNFGSGSDKLGVAGSWGSANNNSVTGQTSVVGTSGATFYITGVQLEKGSTATSFDYRPYGTELALCQRYYYRLQGEAGNGYQGIGIGSAASASAVNINVKYAVQMRAVPTVSFAGSITMYDGSVTPTLTSISQAFNGPSMGLFQFLGSAGGLTLGRAVSVYTLNATTSYMDFSAEL